ncbi:MAG: YihA family ribosome biogenesis GTP-binding protein [Proteobacteria bacterium]|nr:YihA family ribosome biogenesis GTP-binding protein [Pseudomonadota bacterium]
MNEDDKTDDEKRADSERARKLFAGSCDFVAGATTPDVFPPAALPEIAFVGRSNAGKSSLINAITGRSALARVSHTPGRTRQINFFNLGARVMLVDLPGYGYAKASKAMTAEWNILITTYLRGRPSLRRVVLLVDSRRGIMDSDEEVLTLLDQAAMSTLVTLTKADELKPAELKTVIARTEAKAAKHTAAYPEIFVTSAREKSGLDPLKVNLLLLAEA